MQLMEPITVETKIDKSLGHLAARFNRLAVRRINTVLSQKGLGITAEQYSFLIHLWDRNGLPQGLLVSKIDKDKTTVARLASGLEQLGFIKRLPSPNDARERMVYLTDKGKGTMEEAAALIQNILVEAQQGIDAGQLEICRQVLHSAYLNLQK